MAIAKVLSACEKQPLFNFIEEGKQFPFCTFSFYFLFNIRTIDIVGFISIHIQTAKGVDPFSFFIQFYDSDRVAKFSELYPFHHFGFLFSLLFRWIDCR